MENTNDSNNKIVINILNKCNINCKDITMLDGLIIDRNFLINNELYNKIKENIPSIKTILKSSIYTSTQKNAKDNQKWPLINLIRQLLKQYNYQLIPIRIADGYTKDRKKKYKRLFEIKKNNLSNNELKEPNNELKESNNQLDESNNQLDESNNELKEIIVY